MSASLPGNRDLPASQYDLSTYWGRVKQSAQIADPSTLFVSSSGLEHAKRLVTAYKTGETKIMTPEIWNAKKIVDSTLHPGTVAWQIINQSLNVGINSANANKSSPLSTQTLVQSYLLAVSASCSVAVGLNSIVPRLKRVSPNAKLILGRLVPFAAVASAGALNVFLMRGEEIRRGIDVFPAQSEAEKVEREKTGKQVESLGKSKQAATLAVGETAVSRVLNATPVMAIPPLVLVQLQKTEWLKQRPRMVLPINLGLILTTSIFALPLALAAFPQRQAVSARSLEKEFWDKGGEGGLVEFNRGI
ncbi:Sideroflexin FSF1 [Elasticomyces elasticus]|uniref:Sideroflexin FSF1 n=1 Tax=Exophiala sideris TaxID=1016849 RepID=A0ABR0IYS5_9EURO|nr:Sideroflexin FSF1 [Elasticomyces elasticus]KAK5022495.1 Sideroflexin FSF1 [Exophiala sideris]KAK5028023.1 Sideroflexin FSF1 [Exophiala sideris]KAK5051765.1 Sideroflexin FSF1 [Exophiala sideris]KAK5177904.1 Sideroflexin FSF1 [Eurotiomycetes sp. CCFEE 6388]